MTMTFTEKVIVPRGGLEVLMEEFFSSISPDIIKWVMVQITRESERVAQHPLLTTEQITEFVVCETNHLAPILAFAAEQMASTGQERDSIDEAMHKLIGSLGMYQNRRVTSGVINQLDEMYLQSVQALRIAA